MKLLAPLLVLACVAYVIFRVTYGCARLAAKRAWAGV